MVILPRTIQNKQEVPISEIETKRRQEVPRFRSVQRNWQQNEGEQILQRKPNLPKLNLKRAPCMVRHPSQDIYTQPASIKNHYS